MQNSLISNTRDSSLDVAKGLVIILVVLGHTLIKGTYFIFLFHMPFFFALAGYFYKDKYYESIKNIVEYVKNKFNRLLVPFIFFNLVGLFMHNILIYFHAYRNDMTYYTLPQFPLKILWTLLLSRIELITSPSWFLKCLFFSLLLITAISYVSRKTRNFELSRLILILCVSQIGFYCYLHNFNIWLIGSTCSSVLSVYVGIILKKFESGEIKFNINVLIGSFLILFIFDMLLKQQIKILYNFYYNPALLVILTIIGFIFVRQLSLYFVKYSIATKVLTYLGKNTIPIFCLHILVFKLVMCIQYIVMRADISCLNSYPIYVNNGIWWFIYLIFGIGIPLLLKYIYDKIKNIIRID